MEYFPSHNVNESIIPTLRGWLRLHCESELHSKQCNRRILAREQGLIHLECARHARFPLKIYQWNNALLVNREEVFAGRARSHSAVFYKHISLRMIRIAREADSLAALMGERSSCEIALRCCLGWRKCRNCSILCRCLHTHWKEKKMQRARHEQKMSSFDERVLERAMCPQQTGREVLLLQVRFPCSCRDYKKNYKCVHSIGALIREKRLDVPNEAKNVPLGRKRKKGRPRR